MKDLAEGFKALLDGIRSLPKSREQSLAITKLEECAFWTSCASRCVASPIDWAPPILNHVHWMCVEGKRLVEQGELDMAMYWLAFVRGVMWARGLASHDELKTEVA